MKKKGKISRRQQALRELIQTNPVQDQQTLVELMKKRYNITTNQSIVSRDLRVLGVSKRVVGDTLQYEVPAIDASQEILHLSVVDIARNQSMIIIKTVPGLASFVSDYLDAQLHLPIAGTIAGENTIFVAPSLDSSLEECLEHVARILNFKLKM